MLEGNALIGQSCGPTAVINAGRHIDGKNLFVTRAFFRYAAPRVGELPRYASLPIRRARARARAIARAGARPRA